MKRIAITFALLLLAQPAMASDVIEELLNSYRAEGAAAFDGKRGKTMWQEQHQQPQLGKAVSCASCHGTDLTQRGSHIKTGKLIEPLAVRTNAGRLTDPVKIEKWFGRNCHWTYGRACTAQEKGDFLLFIQNY
ncbi:protein of unknown function (DUF1924) [Mariprofundus ferrinatatus]|uniref:Cytochrome c domain-containing protein n=1 Tax=Mariprofundus ferrinatatus TaxID=1921087 RepID=A0A2K8L4L8_9PROT|nr:DUF1924 domain-containing protein [Mariprofundus ferrinatatus]ATX82183.1 protein of unknown function (DUF1924) [Mariprofundus ferrinatatus]